MAFLSFLSPIFGSKPKVAQYHPIDFGAEQLKTIQENLAAWPQIAELGNLFQQYMLGQYEAAIPGFRDILKQGGASVQSMLTQGEGLYDRAAEIFGKGSEVFKAAEPFLHGEIPQDVKDQVQRSSAYQSLMGGTAGSGMAKALTARDLGLTSLNLIDKGAALVGQGANIYGTGANVTATGANIQSSAANAAQRWAALSGAQIPEGMLITPQQQSQLDMQQELIRQATKQTQFNINAAPDPVAKGLSDIVANLTAAYLSKGGGGKAAPEATNWGQTTGTNDWSSNIGQGTGDYTPYSGAYGGYNTPAGTGSSMIPVGNYGGDVTYSTNPYPYNIPQNNFNMQPIPTTTYDLYGGTNFNNSNPWNY